ncbi:hypothetical protein HOK51_09425 [Candidatus Woesearchaeota archaeon]|jgi:glutathione synthase/RimK-type ligase-like ATP-grasp enzyme|nr:hypothetical protein [Candidatus Woesearchaeota archaeon]MBT6520049.1 hypothetical protein [Candidatus Woesearchaeota archaeon]MBT7368432.1 hypothetical protein [Candidatus Woesearchaeota archaeon]
MNRTLLVIGDEKGYDTKEFLEKQPILEDRGIELKYTTYNEILAGDMPDIQNEYLMAHFFFPYSPWDEKIETYTNGRFYGDNKFGKLFYDLMKSVEQKINIRYHNKELSYINSPDLIIGDRDKEITRQRLIDNGIPVAKGYHPETARQLIDIVNNSSNGGLYVKARNGSLSKGITLLTREKWLSNFRYDNSIDKIISKKADCGWTFDEIDQNPAFLDKLIKGGVVIENEIHTPVVDDKKFDLRFTFVLGELVCYYPRTAPAGCAITNATPDNTPESLDFLEHIPSKAIEDAKDAATKAVHRLGYGFGGVDIIFNKDYSQFYVLELNAFPATRTPKIHGFDPLEVLASNI